MGLCIVDRFPLSHASFQFVRGGCLMLEQCGESIKGVIAICCRPVMQTGHANRSNQFVNFQTQKGSGRALCGTIFANARCPIITERWNFLEV